MNIFVNLLILFALAACQVKTQDGASVIAVSSNYSTTLTATSTITADGVSASTISINVKKNGLIAAGETPTFSATGTGNTVGACSVTDANGDSTCTLKSTKAESKSVAVTSPGISLPAVVIFTAGSVNSTNTTISASGPTVANGTAAATITVAVKDAFNNIISGVTPTFSATGSSNTYGTCSSSNTSGLSTCTLKSTKAEVKTLNLLTPVSKTGGTAIFMGGTPVAANTTITGTGPVIADGVSTSTITVLFLDFYNNPSPAIQPTFTATDTGGQNIYGFCSLSGVTGISTCTLKSKTAETKTLSLVSPFSKSDGTVIFSPVTVVEANSSITGTSPVVANGIATSAVTITMKDASNAPVSGVTPTFSATGSANSYGTCSSSNTSGISTCTLSSLTDETKTLSIDTPIVKTGSNVVFTTPTADPAKSSITGTSPVVANGAATSSITIILKDSSNNPVPGQTPTFTATGTNNSVGTCSVTSVLGIATCTLASSTAETKSLSIATPIVKIDGAVVFTSPIANPANSSISGTSPVVANGTATSTVTITLKDSSNNPVPGQTPTFSATGTTNGYGLCSATDASGISICTMTSSTAETKTLSIDSPIVKTGGTVVFTSATASAANSSITGTGPVLADGSASSTVTIVLKDASNNPVVGQTPTFSSTGTSNSLGTCSATDATGVSTCTLTSTKAEIKTLSIATPVIKTGSTVTFTAGSAVAANSSISGTSPVVADGSATSTVTITLNDINNNPVAGETPSFSATGTTNNYGTCSLSNATGVSTCTLDSTTAEVKTLSIATPVIKTGGTVTFTAGTPVAANSSITGSGPVVADGSDASTVTITLKDASNNPVSGQTPTFSSTGTSNSLGTCSVTDATGVSTCTLTSTKAEIKTLSIATPVIKTGSTVTFTAGTPVAANSSITGSGPVVADGSDASTVTITLKDASNNPVTGQTPTFSSTGTSNSLGTCSATDATGVSTCTMTSTKAEVKTLSIATPVIKTGSTVTFTAGTPVAANSSIIGSGPVVADGSDASTVTITLKDASNNPVAAQTPTFSSTGTSNSLGTCSVTDAAGVSTCTMTSTKAEVKTLSIATPVIKTGSTVTFTAGTPVAANSSITGSGPVVADGSDASTVTITLKDASNNPVSGQTPTFTSTGSTNNYGTCSISNTSGISTCTLDSTTAEVKTLSIATPVIKTGGTVTFTAGAAVAANSTIIGTSPVVADGNDTSTVTITLKDANNNSVAGQTPTFSSTGTSNSLGTCSVTDATGVSTCTMTSTKAEIKTLSIATPVIKTGSTVTFTAGTPVAANSSITGSGPVVADGSDASTVTITLKDASNNPVSGQTPTFTSTGTINNYGTCSVSNTSGVSTCTLTSTKAEVKTLSIATPVIKADGNVTFTAGTPVAANSSITGSGPVVADGSDASTVTITLKDASNNPVAGQTPTFSSTGTSNSLGTCSVTDATGVSTCTLTSTKAEIKTLSIATPVIKTGSTVTFTAGTPVAANSSITGSGPVVADGSDASTVTITLKDASNNPVAAQTPTFSSTGTSNSLGTCSATDATGVSTCTLTSTKAEIKTLSIATPVIKTGSTVTFTAGTPVAANSSITGSGPVVADGSDASTVTITLKDASNNPVAAQTPTFSSTGTSNSLGTCSVTDAAGVSTCTMTSTKAEIKTLSIATPVIKTGSTVTFTAGSAVAVNSSITGSGPVIADGSDTSTVSITLKDASNNPVSGQTPTFTSTGTTNNYGTCSISNTSGISTCTLDSTTAEVKTLSIATPVIKTGGTVTFTAGAAVAANSTIIGTSPVVADGSATSTVTITLKDASNNPVSGQTPTFTATGTTNNYGTCSISNTSGISTCTLDSTTAEVKTLSIATPVIKTGGTVTFTAGAAVAANSTIIGTSPVVADGSATSTVTITLKDASNNPVSGQTPTFTATGTSNTVGVCTSTNTSGVSTCSLSSIKAEVKTISIATPVVKAGNTITFNAGPAVAANSSISGSSPTVANGSSTSNVSIVLRDAFNNPVSGQTPTFSATGSSNTFGTCTTSTVAGLSSCTLASTKAEVKTLSITAPVTLTGGTVTFSAGSASIANSTIIGTGPVTADGVDASTIIITLKDAYNNPIIGTTPAYSATDSGTGNIYGLCSATDSSGTSNCLLKSTMAETKTLSITSPISKSDGTVIFNVGSVSVANSNITGTGPVIANGSANSSVTVTLRDAANNPVPGLTPTFSATDTGGTNFYNSCSVTDSFGVSTCTFNSKTAETKTLTIMTPVHRTGSTVVFTPGAPDITNSTITGSGPVVADGAASSTVTITILDAFNNPISGTVPTFTATSTATNNYSSCSSTDSFGVSTCTLKSTKAEEKTLSLTSPVTKAGGTVTFTAGSAVAATSSITGTGPTPADGSTNSTITILLKDTNNNAVAGVTPNFSATGSNNTYGTCTLSDAIGSSSCTLSSSSAESKTLSITSPFTKADGTVQFIAGYPVAANSTITGTSTVIADGLATSSITITLNDASNNPVAGQTPTFTATSTGTNSYSSCSVSNAFGVSTCTLASTKAEIKTLEIATPVSKAGGTVTFIAGAAAATYSTIAGTTNIVADGAASSSVTITLYDANNNLVAGQTPTFSASGTNNTVSSCTISNASGVSTCSLKSTKAETKTLSIATPFIQTGPSVNFIAGAADATKSAISGTSPVTSDGISVSFIAITLNDAFNNPIVGTIPIFNATGSNNSYGSCLATDSNGQSSCTLSSTYPESKFLQLTSPTAVSGPVAVVFSSTGPSATYSTIAGTTPALADGLDASTITITLKDSSNVAVAGYTPIFDATDTAGPNGPGNSYVGCSMSDLAGISTCSLSSTVAESKTLRITNPILKNGSVVVFTAGAADSANSSISGTGPVVANGTATSTITINLKDFYNNPISGTIPTFSASGTANVYSTCTATNALGDSTCTLKSTKAESKLPQILTPVSKYGGNISFIPDAPSATTTTIAGTGPISPDGSSTSTVTITLKDAFSNTISGVTPTFSATGSNNTYGICSTSDTSGVSSCTLASTTAETKTLNLVSPIAVTGGAVQFIVGSAVAANSNITGTTNIVANGTATSAITITLRDSLNGPVAGQTPVFIASGTGNTASACTVSNASGISTCTLKSTKAETKTLSISSPVVKAGGTVTFIPGAPSLATSTILAASPCKANGTDICSVTITIKDAQGNTISGVTPTFTLSGTLNILQACSVTDASGISTCGATSTKAEAKTFTLQTPVVVTGNTVDFNPNGINIEVPIELADRGLASSLTTAVTFTRTKTNMNTTDYVSQANLYRFDIVASNTSASSCAIGLVNGAGTSITSSNISVVAGASNQYYSVYWTPTTGADSYRVKVCGTTTAAQVKISSARIVVEQTAAVATKIYIPLVQADYNLESATDAPNAGGGEVASTSSGTFASSNYFTQWTRNDALYDAIDTTTPWTLETVMNNQKGGGTITATLYNKTTSAAITGATTTVSGSTATTSTASFASNATGFANNNIVELRIKSTGGGNTARLLKAGLWIKLKFLKKVEILQRLSLRNGTTTATASIATNRFYWDSTGWSNPTVYFQTVGSSAAANSSNVALMDNNTTNSGASGGLSVTGSTLTQPTTYGIMRSSALTTLTNPAYYYIRHTSTNTSDVLGSAFMCIQARE